MSCTQLPSPALLRFYNKVVAFGKSIRSMGLFARAYLDVTDDGVRFFITDFRRLPRWFKNVHSFEEITEIHILNTRYSVPRKLNGKRVKIFT